MRLQIEQGPWEQPRDDLEALVQLQNVLLAAVEGGRGGEIDLEYQALRRAVLAEPTYRKITPSFIRSNRDLDSMWPFFKSFNPSWEPRRQMVRGELEPMLNEAERYAFADTSSSGKESSDWTGILSAKQRLVAIKSFVPVAQASVDTLIATLEAPNHNGAPPLDEHESALENLRELHKSLGELLAIEDAKKLEGNIGKRILNDVAKYGKRAAFDLREDPMPYAMSGVLLTVFTALGAPAIANYLAGVAVVIGKNKPD